MLKSIFTYHRLREFLIVFFFLLIASANEAQTYDFKNIGKVKKIQAKYIYDILQGPDQKLYLGTENGLFSYNGVDFAQLVPSKDDIVNVVNQKNQKLYQGYFDGKIGVYDLKSHTQEEFQSPYNSKVIEIEFLQDLVIVLIQSEGIFKLEDGQFKPLSVYNIESSDINDIKIMGEAILVSTSTDLLSVHYADDKWKIKQSIKNYNDNYPVKIEARDDHFFAVLCNDLTVDVFSIQEEFVAYNNVIKVKNLNTRPSDLHFGLNNELWMSTINAGLVKITSSDGDFLSYNVNYFDVTNGLAGDEVKCVFTDNQGVLWLGHYGKGVTTLNSEQVILFENVNGIKLNNVYCIDQNESKGQVYLGHDNGVWVIQFGATNILDSIALPISDVKIKALRFDGKNRLWIGSEEHGLFIYNTETKEVVSSLDLFGEEVLYINRITHNKSNDNIYVSTDLGLFYYQSSTQQLEKLTTNDGLAHNVLNDVLALKSGEIWFASNGSPMFSLKDNVLSVHKDLKGLTSYSAYCLKESSDNRILVGTESDGLVILKNEEVLAKVDETNGLIDNTVFDIVEFEDQTIWAFHKNAISILDGSLNQIKSFSAEDDLFDVDLTKNGINGNSSRYIWVACNKGLLRIQRSYSEVYSPPNIEITEITVNDKSYLSLPEHFKYGSYSVNINFLAVDLSNSMSVQYEYYLEGLETEWNVYASKYNFASYPKLSEGEYVFKLRAKNKWGQYSSEIQVPFTIEIPYWKTWWFIISIPALVLLLILLIFQYRYTRIRKQKLHLEKVVRDRTYELRLEKDNLSIAKLNIEHKNQEITDSINYAERIQHAILPDLSDETILKEKDFFLFYRPCDIVSGDFYWMNYVDGKQIIVVADCTGHGVPGAFMSLISSTLIDKIVFDLGVRDPEGMVKLLDSNIEQVLKSKDSEAKDGIDIGILTIDRANDTIEYCGASRPLYLINDNGLQVYKGGMLAIGDYYDNIEKTYITHKLPIEKGATIYISSDGFPDQFGGPRDRKYMVGKFKKYLLSIKDHDIKTQGELIEKEFVRWKKDTNQTDDVLVVGIKL